MKRYSPGAGKPRGVVAGAAVNLVVAGTANQNVVAAAEENVVAGTAIDFGTGSVAADGHPVVAETGVDEDGAVTQLARRRIDGDNVVARTRNHVDLGRAGDFDRAVTAVTEGNAHLSEPAEGDFGRRRALGIDGRDRIPGRRQFDARGVGIFVGNLDRIAADVDFRPLAEGYGLRKFNLEAFGLGAFRYAVAEPEDYPFVWIDIERLIGELQGVDVGQYLGAFTAFDVMSDDKLALFLDGGVSDAVCEQLDVRVWFSWSLVVCLRTRYRID